MSCFFDTHCHLADDFFTDESLATGLLPGSLSHPAHAHYFLSVATSSSDYLKTVELSFKHPQILSAVGLHPWFIKPDYKQQILELDAFLKRYHDDLSAIGEIGLDKGKGRVEMAWQEGVFEHQLNLAETYQLPVSIHCTKAFNSMLGHLRSSKVLGVMHGFSGGAQMAEQFVEAGQLIGVNSVLLNDNARRYHEMVQAIGLKSLVLESDAPFGMNLPQGNPLSGLGALSIKMADLLQVSPEEVIAKTCENAKRLFLRDTDGSLV